MIPTVDTTSWSVISVTDMRVGLRLPVNYREKLYDVAVGERRWREWRGEEFTTFAIEVRAGPDSLNQATTSPLSWYREYSECRIDISGHPAIIQSLRGGGTIFWGGHQYQSYDVFATVQLGPRRCLHVHAGAPTRSAQEVHLLALRTIGIRPDTAQ